MEYIKETIKTVRNQFLKAIFLAPLLYGILFALPAVILNYFGKTSDFFIIGLIIITPFYLILIGFFLVRLFQDYNFYRSIKMQESYKNELRNILDRMPISRLKNKKFIAAENWFIVVGHIAVNRKYVKDYYISENRMVGKIPSTGTKKPLIRVNVKYNMNIGQIIIFVMENISKKRMEYRVHKFELYDCFSVLMEWEKGNMK